MKKQVLILMAIGCLLPMGIDAICFRYVDGPKDLDRLQVEVDITKIGSYTPTGVIGKIKLFKGATRYWQFVESNLFKSDTFYVTIKEYTSGPLSLNPTLVRGVKLDGKAAYDINIDNNRKVTITKAHDSCQGLTLTREDLFKS